MNTKKKGYRTERRSQIFLEDAGYECLRTADRGVFDIIASNDATILLIQVKSNKWPIAREIKRMRLFPTPPNAVKVIHRWRDGASRPDVRFV